MKTKEIFLDFERVKRKWKKIKFEIFSLINSIIFFGTKKVFWPLKSIPNFDLICISPMSGEKKFILLRIQNPPFQRFFWPFWNWQKINFFSFRKNFLSFWRKKILNNFLGKFFYHYIIQFYHFLNKEKPIIQEDLTVI